MMKFQQCRDNYMFSLCCLLRILRWPRELNALQLKKTDANRQNTNKSRKCLHQFKNTRAAKSNVLWVFAEHVLSNWWRCFSFVWLHLFSSAAVRWALRATTGFWCLFFLSLLKIKFVILQLYFLYFWSYDILGVILFRLVIVNACLPGWCSSITNQSN